MIEDKGMKRSNKTANIIRIVLILTICLYAVFMVFKRTKNSIRIGSKNFTEQILLGEMVAHIIENHIDVPVKKKFNLGGTFVCFNALKSNELDIYVEYTGTGLTAILKEEAKSDPDSVYAIVKEKFKNKWKLIWLKPLGFNNTYTLTMRTEQADNLGITKISDLNNYTQALIPGFNHEFLERPDGYQGLIKHYGFEFSKKLKEMDTGLMYKAIAGKKVDVICGFATDGRIAAFNLVKLEDDKHFFPPYYAAPLVRADILIKYPQISYFLNQLNNQISNEEMAEMNFRVDEKGEKPKNVAVEFLKERDLL